MNDQDNVERQEEEEAIPFTEVNFAVSSSGISISGQELGRCGGWKMRKELGKSLEVNFPSCKA